MTPLVTVMIPSRKRVAKLIATLTQLHLAATGADHETVIWIDDDDTESMAAKVRLEGFPSTTVDIGPRLGYAELDTGYYAGMEIEARAPWVWIAGDDMLVYGDWLGELRKIPLHGFIVQPEVSRLGCSTYPLAEAQAFPIFPRFCWKAYSETFPRPFDTRGSDLLIRNGWATRFLEGVTMWHDRPSEEEIAAHRQFPPTTL